MEILTERLRLREFVPEDVTAVFTYQNDPRYLRYYAWTKRTEKDVRQFLQMFLDAQQETPRRKYQLAVTLRESGQLIGNCGIRRQTAVDHEANMGYELDPEHWGHGYATEAARAIVRFGFEQLQVHRIWADVVSENSGSINVLEKLGMKREGQLRQNQWMKGRWWDTFIYAILEQEWQTIKQAYPGKS
jgi:RimJ/RimL family protein N-acetyltransferase